MNDGRDRISVFRSEVGSSVVTFVVDKTLMVMLYVGPNWAPKEPVLLAAPIRTIYNLKF